MIKVTEDSMKEDSQRSKNVLRRSSKIIRLPGDNSRDAEAPKPWSKAESLIRLIERLPSGFSVEEWSMVARDETFNFVVSIPVSAGKNLTPPEGSLIYIGGSGTFEARFDRYRPATLVQPEEGGEWDVEIDINENSLVFMDEDREVRIDSKQVREVINILGKNFTREFEERISEDLEVDDRGDRSYEREY